MGTNIFCFVQFLLFASSCLSGNVLDMKIGIVFSGTDRVLFRFLRDRINTIRRDRPKDYKGIAIHRVQVEQANLLKYETLKNLSNCNLTVDLSYGNDKIFALSDLLKTPVLTLKPIPRGLPYKYMFSIRPSQQQYAEAMSKVIRFFKPDKTAIVYEADMAQLAAYLSTVTINDSLATSMMPAIKLDTKQHLDWALTVLLRRHLTNVVLVCNPDNLETIVTRALELGVIKEKSRWIVLDMEVNRNISSPAFLGLVGMRMDVIKQDEAETVKNDFEKANKGRHFYREYSEVTYMALLDLAETVCGAIKHLVLKTDSIDVPGVRGVNPDCPLMVRPVSAQIMKALSQQKFSGKTGEVRFNKHNERVVDKMDIVNVKRLEQEDYGEEQSIFEKVGTWYKQSDIVTFMEETKRSLSWNGNWYQEVQCRYKGKDHSKFKRKKKKVTVTTILEAPFCMLKRNTTENGKDKFEGFSIDMINKIAEETPNLYFEIKLSDETAYGSVTDGQWNGLIGELISKKADMALGAITITAQREQVIDFSKPFMDFKISMMLQKTKGEDVNLFAFLLPFDGQVWLSTIGVVFIVAIVLTILDRFSPTGHRALALETGEGDGDEFSLSNSVWFATGSMLGQGGDNTPRSGPGRILVASFWLFILIMISTYTANLAAYFTAKKSKSSISSLEDLTTQTAIRYGVLKDGSLYAFFKGSDMTLYKTMFGQMSMSDSFVTSTKVGVEQVRQGGYAYLTEEPYLKYYDQRSPCNTELIENLLEAKSYGIGLQKDSEFTNEISVRILKLREKGVIEKLRLKWWDHRSECPKNTAKPASAPSGLGLHNLAGVFIILGGGAVLSLCLLVLENRFRKMWIMFISKGESGDVGIELRDAGPEYYMDNEWIGRTVSRNLTEKCRKPKKTVQFNI